MGCKEKGQITKFRGWGSFHAKEKRKMRVSSVLPVMLILLNHHYFFLLVCYNGEKQQT